MEKCAVKEASPSQLFVCFQRNSTQWARASSFTRFLRGLEL